MRPCYEDHLVKTIQVNNLPLLREMYRTHKYIMLTDCSILLFRASGMYINQCAAITLHICVIVYCWWETF
jgi:hypothetical protein